LPGGLPEHRNRNGKQALGVVKPGDVAFAAGGKEAHDPLVGGQERDAQHQRNAKPHPLAEAGMTGVK
jgi:hypothetical protein